MQHVQMALGKHVVQKARAIYMSVTPATTSEIVNFLQHALKGLSKVPDCADAESKLAAWATKHNADIAHSEVMVRMKEYLSGHTDKKKGSTKKAEFNAQQFLAMLAPQLAAGGTLRNHRLPRTHTS